MNTLNEIGREALKLTTEKGFHDTEGKLRLAVAQFPDLLKEISALENARRLALIQSEVSEALEADRKNRHADMAAYNASEKTKQDFEKYIKDSFEDELADAVIRLLELAAVNHIDIETHVAAKMAYNAQRPYKFGKAY